MNHWETEIARKARQEYMKAWRNRNRDHIREYTKEWRSENRGRINEYQQTYWLKRAKRVMDNQTLNVSK